MPEKEEELILLGQAGYTRAAVEKQVEALCNSDAFKNTDEARTLLRHLVSEALAGKLPSQAGVAQALGNKDFTRGEATIRALRNDLRKYMKKYYAKGAKLGEIRFVIPQGQYLVLAPRASAPNTDLAVILEPSEGEEVRNHPIVRGRISEGLDADLEVWVVINTPCRDLYPAYRIPRNSTEWQYEATIGLAQWGADEGAEYIITLVALGPDGDYAFREYMRSNRNGFGPLLPSDATVLTTTKVIRRDLR